MRNFSVGNADTYIYTVQGWRQSDGSLWTVGNTVGIHDDFVQFPDDESWKVDKSNAGGIRKLLSKVVYKISASGTTCDLECKSEDAFLNTELEDAGTAGSVKPSDKTAGAVKK